MFVLCALSEIVRIFSVRRYDDIVEKLGPFLKSCGYKKTDLIFLPMSGLMGDNIRDKVDPKRCPWYKVRCLCHPTKVWDGLGWVAMAYSIW